MPSFPPSAAPFPASMVTPDAHRRPLPLAGYLFFLFLAGALLYGGFLWNPPVFDDMYFFNGVTPLQYTHQFTPWKWRWLPYASYGWTQRLLGLNLAWYHLGNLLLHVGNAVLLMLLLRRLFARVLKEASADTLSMTACAFWGALLFLLHPAAVYAVAYLNQRSTLMALFFALLSLHCVISGTTTGKSRDYWLAALCYGAAVFSKEHAVMLPAVALAMLFLIEKPSPALLRKVALPALLCLLIALDVTWQVKGDGVLAAAYQSDGQSLLARTLGTGTSGHPWPLSIITQCALFFKYWLLWLIPNPAWMSVDMYEPFAHSLLGWPQFPGFVGFLLYGGIAIRWLLKRERYGLLGFALLVPWLLFATELVTVRIQEPFVLYRSYLWMALPLSCLPVLLQPLGRKRAVFYLSLIGLALIPLSVNRLQSFSHPLLLWDDAIRLAEQQPVQPGMERLYYNRGTEFARLKQYDRAVQDFSHAIRIDPAYSYAYLNRGTVFHKMGQDRRALADFNASLALNRKDASAWWDRGLTLAALGRPAEAKDSFAHACRQGLAVACKK